MIATTFAGGFAVLIIGILLLRVSVPTALIIGGFAGIVGAIGWFVDYLRRTS